MSSRLSELKEAVKIGYSDWGIEESITGMYRCKVYESDGFDEDADKPLEISNVCAKCLFMEDEIFIWSRRSLSKRPLPNLKNSPSE